MRAYLLTGMPASRWFTVIISTWYRDSYMECRRDTSHISEHWRWWASQVRVQRQTISLFQVKPGWSIWVFRPPPDKKVMLNPPEWSSNPQKWHKLSFQTPFNFCFDHPPPPPKKKLYTPHYFKTHYKGFHRENVLLNSYVESIKPLWKI